LQHAGDGEYRRRRLVLIDDAAEASVAIINNS
jgi:hypothetical protein